MNISGPAAVAKPEMLFYAPGDLTVTLLQFYLSFFASYHLLYINRLNLNVSMSVPVAATLQAICSFSVLLPATRKVLR